MESCGKLWKPVEDFRRLWKGIESYGILWKVIECYGKLYPDITLLLRHGVSTCHCHTAILYMQQSF